MANRTIYTEKLLQKALESRISKSRSHTITARNLRIQREYHPVTGLQQFGQEVNNIFEMENDNRTHIEIDFVEYNLMNNRLDFFELKCDPCDNDKDIKYYIYKNFCDHLWFLLSCNITEDKEIHDFKKPDAGLMIYDKSKKPNITVASNNSKTGASFDRQSLLKVILIYGKHIKINRSRVEG